jgi:hypothetical protein
VNADAVRPAYLAAQERESTDRRRALEEQRVAYARFRTDQPLDAALRQYLASRARRR